MSASGPVVVVGGGQAACTVAAALREGGCRAPVTLVAGEGVLPYQRPPLSKDFLGGSGGGFEDVVLRTRSFYDEQGIDVIAGDPAVAVDRAGRGVVLGSGRRLPYERLVLALGARPRTLDVPGAGLDGVLTLRTVADAREVRRRLEPCRRLVVVGAGFIGLEVAAAAAKRGVPAMVVETQPRAMARALSETSAAHLVAEHRAHDTQFRFGRRVTGFLGDLRGRVRGVALDDGVVLPADLVVVGVGVRPHTALAEDAGLVTDDGIVVDAYLRTSDPAISAVGDCARHPSAPDGGTERLESVRPESVRLESVRLESVQNATDTARAVAADICGNPVPYRAVPRFWTTQHTASVQIAGLTAGYEETVVTGALAAGRFSVLCFGGGRLLGVESVNRPADHMAARRLLATDAGLTAREASAEGFDLMARSRTAAMV
ncbi:hypothetical protein AMK26_33415 [Streptomyces sp. CB03234]|uniref:NAD(P)/FAD-dependent oxidoreductase n=1 Tax=Streptomyces sp. (strain CB03234) TaxID=1703937 RepID=UPI00093E934E|nr:FAD-dependent oxidoreductase [Streptomyces sp. CB03234]OKJ94690.1 hypothetical protein AMK26_33415 [Streptomyces sp. CB03234]